MLFNSPEFLFIFLPIVFIGYFLLNRVGFYKTAVGFLCIASLYFYAYYKLNYLPIIISSVIFNYTMGKILQKDFFPRINRKYILWFTLVGNLLLLSYYKYFDFLIESIDNLFGAEFNTMHLLLPLGISFFTFQQIAYVVDSYKKEVTNSRFIDYCLFVTFFPQLIAGPIIHHREIIPQFEDMSKKTINTENISAGFFFITVGLVKKVLLADNFTPFIKSTIDNLSNTDFLNSWLLALSIGSQGYFDFSGYCDMAIGLGLLFNITLPINFNSPYQSVDISEYWRRWHITLGRFLKNYVYIPLGGSRAGQFNTYRNLLIVFLLTGIWHGANWPCLLYGVINGILVCLNKFWRGLNITVNKHLAIGITFITMIFIAPLVLIKTLPEYTKILTSMLGINTHFNLFSLSGVDMVFPNGSKLSIILILLSLFIILKMKNSNEWVKTYIEGKYPSLTVITAVLFVISCLSFNRVSEFIYFQF